MRFFIPSCSWATERSLAYRFSETCPRMYSSNRVTLMKNFFRIFSEDGLESILTLSIPSRMCCHSILVFTRDCRSSEICGKKPSRTQTHYLFIMGEGSLASILGAPRSPEFVWPPLIFDAEWFWLLQRRLSQRDRGTLDSFYSTTKAFAVWVPISYIVTIRLGEPPIDTYHPWLVVPLFQPRNDCSERKDYPSSGSTIPMSTYYLHLRMSSTNSPCREELICRRLFFGRHTYIPVGHSHGNRQSIAKFLDLSSKIRDWWSGSHSLLFPWKRDGHILIKTRFWAMTLSLKNSVKRRPAQVWKQVTFADFSDFRSCVSIWGEYLANESNL